MVDARDSKSRMGNHVRVQFPPAVPIISLERGVLLLLGIERGMVRGIPPYTWEVQAKGRPRVGDPGGATGE
jgi:hypothetical protein